MQYRTFGRLGHRVSALGFGAMRLPEDGDQAVEVIRCALDEGVNFVDTAPGYMNGTSEQTVGRALKERRQKVFLSTKARCNEENKGTLRSQLEESLRNLDTDYVDFYHMWGINWDKYENVVLGRGGHLEQAREARDEGLIRHISFSFHDIPDNLIKLIDTGNFDSMLVQYNMLDRRNEEAIHYAHERGLGVAVMGPVGGGRLSEAGGELRRLLPPGYGATPALALRFVLSHPGVSVALSGMGSVEMVRENAAAASRGEPFNSEEKEAVYRALDQVGGLADLYCTGCRYCMPCPNEVAVPQIFSLYIHHKVYGLTDYARDIYRRLQEGGPGVPGAAAEACTRCGECETKCPQNIAVVEQLEEAHRALRPA